MKSIETEIIARDRIDNDATAYTQSKSENINGGISLMTADTTPGDFEIISKHKNLSAFSFERE
jgi:hypothetical protein